MFSFLTRRRKMRTVRHHCWRIFPFFDIYPHLSFLFCFLVSSCSFFLLHFWTNMNEFSHYSFKKVEYGVFFKKVFHKQEEKMQEKMKMTKQKDKNLVQVQKQCSVYFCIEMFFKSWFVLLLWPLESLILMILTLTKYHENLLNDSTLSLLFIVKFFSPLETLMKLKTPNETFLKITQYFL